MPPYLVTGASRGLGFEFLDRLSQNSANTVVGLVRDVSSAVEKVNSEFPGRNNLHIVQGDLADYESLKNSVSTVSDITGGKLDYIIANAALVSKWSGYDAIGVLGQQPEKLEADLMESFKINAVGNVHLLNLYMPLVLKGTVKKVTAISTGMADPDLISKYDVAVAGPYAISKAALNVAMAKFSAQYRKDGVLFLSISPGLVDTGNNDENTMTPEQALGFKAMAQAFASYAPYFKGPITPQESVTKVLAVIEQRNVEYGDAGAFISHYGNKQWL